MASEFIRRTKMERTIQTLETVLANIEYPDLGPNATVEQLYSAGFKEGLQLAIDTFKEAIVPVQKRLEQRAEQSAAEFNEMIKIQREAKQ